MKIFQDDSDLEGAKATPNQKKFHDMWWAICSTTGAGKTFLKSWIPRLGADWRPIPNEHTSVEQEVGALPQNFTNIRADIAEVKAMVEQLARAQGVTIDEKAIAAAIAKAVVDETANRLAAKDE